MNSVNFLTDQNQHSIDKFVTWALTYGRTIVMITELIALLAFLYRFTLDAQLSDLHDKITAQQHLVAASQNLETRDRNLQDRLALASSIDTQAATQVQYVFSTLDQAKGNVTFETLTEEGNAIKIQVNTANSASLNAFVQDLRNNTSATDISIDSLQTKGQSQTLEAAITITLPGGTN